jgi:hypothetical protein
MITITMYDAETGIFGPIMSGSEEDMVIRGNYLEGAYDGKVCRLDLSTMEVVPYTPPPTYNELKQKRNELLDSYRWTIMPDSPLSESCQAQWMAWLESLHSLLVGVTDFSSVTWPDMPPLEYK